MLKSCNDRFTSGLNKMSEAMLRISNPIVKTMENLSPSIWTPAPNLMSISQFKSYNFPQGHQQMSQQLHCPSQHGTDKNLTLTRNAKSATGFYQIMLSEYIFKESWIMFL